MGALAEHRVNRRLPQGPEAAANCGAGKCLSVTSMAQSFEYKVVELREGMVGGKMSGDKLEKTLNEHGRQGWQLKAGTSVEIKGRLGPGGVEGVLVTFERPKG